ncbi:MULTISPECIES: aromatic ring-hydroxylating dioxygenase subunit alpha [unclassified Variovorax]|uniref:aromatic ring-hydroxylating oxygenase subunit alpha n=1 Tax=unclassified Variovorax TaxID=663243 RepID=UPI0032E6987F
MNQMRAETPMPPAPPAGLTRRPLPYPNGWFAVCFSDEIRNGTVHTLPFMGGELVVYRTQSGAIKAVSPYCPHLGAHLGHGGKVDEENLVCPFHKLKYAPDGRCVRPDGERPIRAPMLSCWQVHEWNGAVFVWHDSEGRQPDWVLPEVDLAGFVHPITGSFELGGYVQDVAENLADLTHFWQIHGFKDVEQGPLRTEGPRMECDFKQKVGNQLFQFQAAWLGLGCNSVMLQFPGLGLRAYTQTMFTPIAPLKWVFRVRHVFRLAWLERWPKLLSAPIYGLLRVAFQYWFHRENMKDRQVWDTKCFDPEPRLVPGDGPIMAYRRWAAQFYPAASADQVSPLKVFAAPAEGRQPDRLAATARSRVE